MKNTILKRILIAVALPMITLLVFSLLYTSRFVMSYKEDWWQNELANWTEINELTIAHKIDTIKGILCNAAHDIENAYSQNSDRDAVDQSVRSLLLTNDVFNAWITFEPNAFDGNDSLYKDDYPGAPSGRLIRSYSRINGEITVIPDMDENAMNDPEQNIWYTRPLETGEFYYGTLINNHGDYDYKVAGTPEFTVSLVSPIKTPEGKVIGCIGADVSGEYLFKDIGTSNSLEGSLVVLFDQNGDMLFSPMKEFKYSKLGSLGFEHTEEIKEAIDTGKPLFLEEESSYLLDTDAMAYFMPIYNSESLRGICVCIVMPRQTIYDETQQLSILITFTLSILFILIFLLVYFVVRMVTNPIQKLTDAARDISAGNLQAVIPVPKSYVGEISELSGSLYRMVEQFRVNIAQNDRDKKIALWRSAVSEIMLSSLSRQEAARRLSDMLKDQFKASRVRIFVVLPDGSVIDTSSEASFEHHSAVMKMFGNRELFFANYGVLNEMNCECIEKDTIALLALQLRDDQQTIGYIILERNDRNTSSVSSLEEDLLSQTKVILSEWMMIQYPNQTENRDAADDFEKSVDAKRMLPEDDAYVTQKNSFYELLGNIPFIDAEYAFSLLDGQADIFEKGLRVVAKQISPSITRLRDFIERADWDGYTIEIHGIKGSMNSIGASELGMRAAEFEKSAKAGDYDFCSENFEAYIEQLFEFRLALLERFPENVAVKQKSDTESLLLKLPELLEAVTDYDIMAASAVLQELSAYTYADNTDELLSEISEMLDGFQYEAAAEKIEWLIASLELGDE